VSRDTAALEPSLLGSRPIASPPGEEKDAYAPPEIAARVRAAGVAKAKTDGLTLFALAVLAGAFIGLGGAFYTVVVTESGFGLGPTRFLGGCAFSLGLVLVVVGGAELFTGNNLIAMAWASRLVTTREIMRNWIIVYVGNILGGTLLVAGVYWVAYLRRDRVPD
jgi:formate transporter